MPPPPPKPLKRFKGFTLAELLIALLILGEIATFTIPKILSATRNGQSNAAAHEALSMVSSAYQQYTQTNVITAATNPSVLTPYMNYVSLDTVSPLDDHLGGNAPYVCGSDVTCLKLHNGGTLFFPVSWNTFGGLGATNAVLIFYDPDGVKGTTGSADGPSKSVGFILYANGRITSRANTITGTNRGDPGNFDPSWFTW